MARPVYVSIARDVVRIHDESGEIVAGEYLEGIMEEEFSKIREDIKGIKKDVVDAVANSVKEAYTDPEIARLRELAGLQ